MCVFQRIQRISRRRAGARQQIVLMARELLEPKLETIDHRRARVDLIKVQN